MEDVGLAGAADSAPEPVDGGAVGSDDELLGDDLTDADRLHAGSGGNSSGLGEDARFEVTISALEHFSYCPRQCGLIHLEATFDDNVYTVRGKLAHERVDEGDDSLTRGVPIYRNVPLWSDRLGLFGKSDLIEMRPTGPFPVEYKVGRRRGAHADIQLCA